MPDEAEAALIARARRGDRAAFSVLVAAHEARVRQFVSRVAGPGDTDDISQEALVKAWLSLAAYRGAAPFGAWLAGIAWRAALDHRRGARRAASRDAAWSAEREHAAEGPGAAPVELARALHRLGSEALVLLALAGAAATLARAPAMAEAMAGAPLALPAALGAVLLGWLALSPQRGPAGVD